MRTAENLMPHPNELPPSDATPTTPAEARPDSPASRERRLSEISHLFLSSVRERQTKGSALPARRPPATARRDAREIPATTVPSATSSQRSDSRGPAAEGGTEGEAGTPPEGQEADRAAIDGVRDKPLVGIVARHLGAGMLDSVRQYAGHLAHLGRRVGLIHVAADAVRVWCVEPDALASPDDARASGGAHAPAGEFVDARRLGEALVELDADTDVWLLSAADAPSAGIDLVRSAARWVVLTTADHDGVIGAYRSMKAWWGEPTADGPWQGRRPFVSLAVLDAASDAEAGRVHRRVAAACEQFLGLSLLAEGTARLNPRAGEWAVLTCAAERRTRPSRHPATLPATPSAELPDAVLAVLRDFVASGQAADERDPLPYAAGTGPTDPPAAESVPAQLEPADLVRPPESLTPTLKADPMPYPSTGVPGTPSVPALARASAFDVAPPVAGEAPPDCDVTVVSLPDRASTSDVLRAAVAACGDLVPCPLAPPALPEGVVSVTRTGRLVLSAAAAVGGGLPAVLSALRWLTENRLLLAMAFPQFRIDADAEPQLRLYADPAARRSLAVDSLRPLLRDNAVSLHPYRTLRWGDKTGLLLEAA